MSAPERRSRVELMAETIVMVALGLGVGLIAARVILWWLGA